MHMAAGQVQCSRLTVENALQREARITYRWRMAVVHSPFPNLPGVAASGPFRLRLNKFHGRKQISLVYKEKFIAAFDPDELVDLEEVVRRMTLYVTEESYAKLPPDEG
jgi:hypothetical protein